MASSNTNIERLYALAHQPLNEQSKVFLQSFIFELDQNWKQVAQLQNAWSMEVKTHENTNTNDAQTLNETAAAGFLQKHAKTRTALQRKQELDDVNFERSANIPFIAYLILHYKELILRAYYKRHKKEPEINLDNGAIGVIGVGEKLVEELFTFPEGVDPELMRAIDDFTKAQETRQKKMHQLSEMAAQGGVKGLTAANELKQMETQDMTVFNRLELTLNAAKKRSKNPNGEKELRQRQEAEAHEAEARRLEGRQKLASRAAMFDGSS